MNDFAKYLWDYAYKVRREEMTMDELQAIVFKNRELIFENAKEITEAKALEHCLALTSFTCSCGS